MARSRSLTLRCTCPMPAPAGIREPEAGAGSAGASAGCLLIPQSADRILRLSNRGGAGAGHHDAVADSEQARLDPRVVPDLEVERAERLGVGLVVPGIGDRAVPEHGDE